MLRVHSKLVREHRQGPQAAILASARWNNDYRRQRVDVGCSSQQARPAQVRPYES
jgi:hypothetical protein